MFHYGSIKDWCILSIVLVICLFGLFWFRPHQIGTTDFIQYWTSTQLLTSGGNVYTHAEVEALQRGMKIPEFPVYMWNPPYILPLFLWSAIFSFEQAASLWIFISLGLTVLSIALLERVYLTKRLTRSPFLLVFLFTCYPLALMVYYGQISSLLLFSFSVFLFYLCRTSEKKGLVKAGFFLGISLIKPHLLWLNYLFLALKGGRRDRWMVAGGAGLFLALSCLVVVLFSVSVFSGYLTTWGKAPPFYWKTPTAGSWLQGLTGIHAGWVRILPTVSAGGLFLLYLWRKKPDFSRDTITALIPFSLIFSPYGWVYDQLLLLPCVFQFAATGRKLALLSVITANLLMISISDGTGQEWMIWYPVVFAIFTSKDLF